MNPFQLLIKPVSSDCNLTCDYCFYLGNADTLYPGTKHHRMSDSVLETMISHYIQLRFPESVFGWQGGEPSLAGLKFFQKVIELQQKYGSSGQVIGNAFQTNGVLINEEWSRFFHQYKFLIGLSLDGPKSIHDRFRHTIKGESVWEKVMHAATLFQENDVSFNILCVITKANIQRVEEVYEFFKTHGFKYVQFIPALGEDICGKRASFTINANQYGKFLIKLFELWKKDPFLVSINFFDSILNYILHKNRGYCSLEAQCADYLLVEYTGDVYPCDFFVQPHWKLGNLNNNSFEDLWTIRNSGFGLMKSSLSDTCKNCKWLSICYGGCVKDRLFRDNPRSDRSFFCEGYSAFFEYALPWFNTFANQNLK